MQFYHGKWMQLYQSEIFAIQAMVNITVLSFLEC